MTIRALVERERRHLRQLELAAAILAAIGAIAMLFAGGAALLGGARWLSLPRGLPLLLWLLAFAAASAVAIVTRKRLRRETSGTSVAHAIEVEQSIRRGALVGALEIEGRGALAERAVHGIRSSLSASASLAPARRSAGSRRIAIAAGVAAVAIALLASTSPLFGDGLRAVLRPVDAWRGSLLERPAIHGAPVELLRGSPVTVTIHAPGRRQVYLDIHHTGDAWRTDTLDVNARSGDASWTMDALRGDLRLVATDGRAVSDSVLVHAADRPFVGAVILKAHYPAYLGRSDESLPVGEPLHLPRGTVLEVSGRASIALADVALVEPSGTRILLAASGQTFNGRFTAERSEALAWSARGPGGLVPDLPEALNIDVVPDSAPSVQITEPASDTMLVSGGAAALALHITDDHGVAGVYLRVVRAGVSDAVPLTSTIAGAVGTTWSGEAIVNIDSLRLAPGDAVRVRAEAVDASPWAQRGISRELLLRRATSEEQRTAARTLGDAAVKEAQAAAKAEQSLAQKTSEAARAQARQNPAEGNSPPAAQKMDFESAQKAKNLAQEQRAMADRVQKLRQATKQLEEQLKAANALDSSLQRQLSEAQALMRQALTPELMKQMEKLENASQQMNGDQSRDAMRDLAQMQQKMREQLEKSAEMLKRAAEEGAMQTLSDEAKELAQKERALAEKENLKDASQVADRAERLKKAMDDLKARLEKDRAEAGAKKAQEAADHAAKSETELRDAAKALNKSAQDQDKSDKKDGQQGSKQDAQQGSKQDGQQGSKQDGQQGSQQDGQQGSKQDGQQGSKQDGQQGSKQDGQQGSKQDGQQGSKQDGQQGSKQDGQQGSKQDGSQQGGQSGKQQAMNAASEMDKSAQSMQDARNEQVKEWKRELTSELDQSVQEMMQLARQERSLEQKARQGNSSDDRRSEQSAVEQGVDKANERLNGEGKKSALLSSRSQRAMSDAKQKVSEATQSVTKAGSGQGQANALADAANALTTAAGSLARDRERANSSSSASGFEEMLKQLQELAQKQGQINGQSQNLFQLPNGANSAQGQSLARSLARQQRQLAEQLDEAGDAGGGNKAAQLAQEARQLAEAMDNGRLDGGTLARQQQLFRRMLDAGKTLEKEERDDNGKREAKSANGADGLTPGANVNARAAVKFKPPTWDELRGLSADERRAILDYFTRLNSGSTP